MPVTFVIGRAGTGKTFRTFDRVKRLVEASPLGADDLAHRSQQSTFQVQRELVAQLGAVSRIRVADFGRLGEEVLAEVGGVQAAHVTVAGRRMILGRLLYKHYEELTYFKSSARRPGLAAAIDELFDELDRSGKTLGDLGDLIDRLGRDVADVGAVPLHAKLADLRKLYGWYADYVGTDRLDPRRWREEVLAQLGRSKLLAGSHVFVDAFYDFTEHERRSLAAVATLANQVEVNLSMPPDSPVLVAGGVALPDELSPFFRAEVAYAKLRATLGEAGVTFGEPVLLNEVRRFTSEPLAQIERELFPTKRPAAASEMHETVSGESAVAFFEAPDARAEVQAVARRIRDLLADGYRQRDVVVLTRRLDDYLHLIHAAFAEHGITYFVDRRRPATHHPLVRLVRSAVRIARDGWQTAAVMGVAKSGLAGLAAAEVDALDNYLHEHGITAPAWMDEAVWAYADHVAAADEEFDVPAPAAADRTRDQTRRHLVDRLQPLVSRLHRRAPEAPLRDLAAGLMQTLERFDVRTSLARWIAADAARDPEQAEEHQQVWAQLVALVEEMVDVLGDEVVEPGEFVEVLESGLDAFDLAITPPTVDQVLVGSVDRTRTLFPKVAFVLGLSRGVFPPTHRDQSLLSGPERRELHKHKIDVEPDSGRRQLDERFLAYVALTRASERVVVSRPRADGAGRAYDASEYWLRLRELFPDVPVASETPCTGDEVGCLSTPRDVIASLLDWARQLMERDPDAPAKEQAGDTWRRELYDWLSRRTFGTDEFSRLVERAWPSLCYKNDASLSRESAAALFPSPLVATASELESFASCPFQHFVTYGLRLGRRSDGSITAMDLSRVYHDVLEEIVKHALKQTEKFADLPPAELSAIARRHAPAVAERIRGQVQVEEARTQYLLKRVGDTLDMVLGTVREQLARGKFEPMTAGSAFGPDAKVKSPELPTPGGGVVRLRGRIDRIDVAPDGAIAVYDYRMGEARLNAADVYHGLNLRLLTCLLVIDRAGASAKGKKLFPAAAFCSRLLRSLGKVDHPSEAADPASPEYRLSAKPRGVLRGSHVGMLDKELTTGQSSVVNVWVNKDGTFGRRDYADVAEDAEFRSLLDFVERKVQELAGGILGGRVAVEPYLYHDASPCVRCDYRPICRFEPTLNRYRKLQGMKRGDAIAAMRQATAGSAGEGDAQ